MRLPAAVRNCKTNLSIGPKPDRRLLDGTPKKLALGGKFHMLGQQLKSELVEEYLVPHFRVAKELRPADDLHIEVVVAEPAEPTRGRSC
jgi:hypothetical protein